MASNITYSMGQYRYNGDSETCMQSVTINVANLDWQDQSTTSPWYRDIIITPPNTLSTDTSYYLTFGIPRNQNYNLNFELKLFETKPELYNESLNYQFVKHFNVQRVSAGNSSNSRVVLYQMKTKKDTGIEEEGWARAAVENWDKELPPKYKEDGSNWYTWDRFYPVSVTVDANSNPTTETNIVFYPHYLYYATNLRRYWMYRGTDNKNPSYIFEQLPSTDSNAYNALVGTNDIIMNWNWETSSSADMVYCHCIFSPTVSNMKYIVLRLIRINEDADIATSEKTTAGNPIYGRYIDLSEDISKDLKIEDTFKLYTLTNLNKTILDSQGNTIKRIGLWSHPGLMFSINGEELKIGSSGYYELNDFDITTLAVVADGPEDKFVLDYQYQL